MPVTLGVVNVYLFVTPGGGTLIDTGTSDPGALAALTRQLAAHRLRARQTAAFHRARLRKVADVLTDEPRSALAISVRAFGEKARTYSRWLSLSSAVSLLGHLYASGEAQRVISPEGEHLYLKKP